MAPPVGTLRVGRYFTALALLFAILYAFVAFGSTQKPKLGLDLVGGIRVVFTALTPKGSPPPTSDQMNQARQILEDRINSTGVTGSTVVVQGSNQLVVEIPNGTKTDLATLGSAAILNFRGVVAPAQAVSCTAQGIPSTSGSSSPSTSATGSASTSASNATKDFRDRPLAAAPSTSAASTARSASGSATSSASGSSSGTPSTSPSATPTPTQTAAAPTRCVADPFSNPKAPAAVRALRGQLISLYGIKTKNPLIWNVLPNAETCPSPGLSDSACRAYDKLSSTQQAAITTGLQSLDCGSTQVEPDLLTGAYYACDDGRLFGTKVAYLLGHVVVQGKQIDSAAAEAPNASGTGSLAWTVSLKLTSSGGNNWHAWTSKYNTTDQNQSVTQCGASAGTPCSDFVGFTLDGQVISAPVTLAALDINTSISGNFSQSSAQELARELNYGKLPVNFRADDTETVSATLGSKQLKAAFLAGGIGLALVVIYSLLYYRALGLVTIASLMVSAGLTYAFLVILGKQIGFTLDLAGIAGFIVALGITADSFVVFFERLKDEVHEGRSARVAVPRAWVRARRTILSADTVSFLAAAILYYFASADVKGFAFTLGMSTILDLVVVFLFTHPLVALLSRSAVFGSRRFTGLDAVRGTRTAPVDEPVPVRQVSRPVEQGDGAEAAASERFRGSAVLTRPDDEPRDEVQAGPDEEPAPDEAHERRRTAPEPGSAAERAAARRARLRDQRNRPKGGER